MGINPSGGQVLVAQGLLEQASVLGGPEHVRDKAVAQDMGMDVTCPQFPQRG